MTNNPTSLEDHFAFGKNWASYAQLVGAPEIEEAKAGLLKLLPASEIAGRSFLDIGCGSGLHALAAAELGAGQITAIDIDPDSVSTTQTLLQRHKVKGPWQADQTSVFDTDPAQFGTFDVVYSWGVLHHTGDMWLAIKKAADLVRPGGLFAFALYRTTRMDAFWKREKRWYAHARPAAQMIARAIYLTVYRLYHLAKGVDHGRFVAMYRSARGMDFHHDVHDWLGGYPYETALATEVEARMAALGFKPERVFALSMTRGVLGSGCDEYVYRKSAG